MAVRSTCCHFIFIKLGSRNSAYAAVRQSGFAVFSKVRADGLPEVFRCIVHPVNALGACEHYIGIRGVVRQWRIPPNAVFFVNAIQKIVPNRFFIGSGHAEAPISPLIAGIAQEWIFGMVNACESISTQIAGPFIRRQIRTRGGPIVLGTAGVHSWIVWIPRDAVKLGDGYVFNVLPRKTMIVCSVQAAIRS